MRNPLSWVLSFLVVAIFVVSPLPVRAQEVASTCAVYFTGVGCSHCAKTDPVILGDLLDRC